MSYNRFEQYGNIKLERAAMLLCASQAQAWNNKPPPPKPVPPVINYNSSNSIVNNSISNRNLTVNRNSSISNSVRSVISLAV